MTTGHARTHSAELDPTAGHVTRARKPSSRRHRRAVGADSGRPTASTVSTGRANGPRFSRSTRRRRPSAVLHMGSAFGYVQTDALARYQRMRGPRGLLPDGLGRQRPRDRAARAELLRRALRPAPAVRPGVRAAGEAAEGPDRDLAARTSSSCARDSSPRTSRRSRSCGAGSGSRSTGRSRTRRSGPRRAARASARSCATSRVVRRTRPTRRRSGTSTCAPRSRRPSSKTASSPARTTRCASTARDGAGDLLIDTTRPELLAACVAVVAHPDDERYQPLFGTEVTTPLYGVSVPVVAHRLADPEKGTGIAMICTFGDVTDVVWWRELQLPTRAIIGVDGRHQGRAARGRRRRRARARTRRSRART